MPVGCYGLAYAGGGVCLGRSCTRLAGADRLHYSRGSLCRTPRELPPLHRPSVPDQLHARAVPAHVWRRGGYGPAAGGWEATGVLEGGCGRVRRWLCVCTPRTSARAPAQRRGSRRRQSTPHLWRRADRFHGGRGTHHSRCPRRELQHGRGSLGKAGSGRRGRGAVCCDHLPCSPHARLGSVVGQRRQADAASLRRHDRTQPRHPPLPRRRMDA
mmetsp:Transcript_31608/g.75456  ORF Transcript_31608/g.75456 Transcript_31608/m.75456 type:complete len:214 (-) Transcript_31608:13-654(-)